MTPPAREALDPRREARSRRARRRVHVGLRVRQADEPDLELRRRQVVAPLEHLLEEGRVATRVRGAGAIVVHDRLACEEDRQQGADARHLDGHRGLARGVAKARGQPRRERLQARVRVPAIEQAQGSAVYTLTKIQRWKRQAEALSKCSSPAIALDHYWAVDKRLRPLEEEVSEAVWRYDEEIDAQIH